MASGIGYAIEAIASYLMSMLKTHINDYCELETTYGNSFVAKDGSMGTILMYSGFRSLIGRDEYKSFSNELADSLEQFLAARGHQIQVVYYRDDDPSTEIDKILQPSYDTAARLELDLGDLINEKRSVARHYCMDEKVFIILWTRPAVLDPVEFKISKQEQREMMVRLNVPPMKNAQNILRPIRFMIDRHESFVAKVIDEIRRLKGAVVEVEIHDAFCEMKRYLYSSTPDGWRPTLIGDELIARWKNRKGKDISELMAPRLEDQLFIAPSANGGIDGLTDTKSVRISNRIFAPVVIKLPPQRPQSFTKLFAAMNNSSTKNADGKTRPIPWSLSYVIEGDGLKGIGLRKIFAGILAWTSQDNRNMVAAAQTLNRYKESGGGVVVKLQMTALTWAEVGQEKELLIRRSKLSRAIAGWGNITVEEETGDPTEAVIGCVPGATLTSIAPASAPPLHDLTMMLPLSRPASPFNRGTTLLRTLDGKLMQWEVFSDQQNTWITLIFGGPGSGKSVLANRLNEEMCLLGGLTRLPYICVIDIGISSSGFISLVQDSLPEQKKYLAFYARLQNTRQYAINQFDTQLGQRIPLPRERDSMKNFLVRLATPPERGKAHTYMSEFVGRVLDESFKRTSDSNDRGNPKEFTMSVNPMIGEKVRQSGIVVQEATKWWDIVDAFFDLGMTYEASVAQRYAVPVLFDILNAASDPGIQKEFENAVEGGMKVADEFKLMINSAMADFPIFNGITEFDIGESRVMALDLQDVVTTGSSAAKKQASLMYMVALNAFMRKVSVIKEDLDLITKRYVAYHARRVDELQEDLKRLFCDEFHKTGADVNLRESFLIYGRESRKWQLEIVLSSQMPQDFAELVEIATTIIILDAGNEQTRGTIRKVFGLSDTEVAALRGYVHGARPGIGATFLAKIKTKDAELSQLFTATSGGLELWGLSTTAEDRALRNALYKAMPSSIARQMLKNQFPSGSCKSYVLDKKAQAKDVDGEGFVDEEVTDSVIVMLAEKMIAKWRDSDPGTYV